MTTDPADPDGGEVIDFPARPAVPDPSAPPPDGGPDRPPSAAAAVPDPGPDGTGNDDPPRNLPAVPDAPRGPAVLEGRVIQAPVRSVPGRAVTILKVIAAHDRTRAARRNVSYVAVGGAVVARRLWDSRTTARYERMMRAVEATGDHDKALEWEARLAAFRRDRHQRRMDWIEAPARLLAQLPKIAAGTVAVLAALGILLAVATRNIREIAAPVDVLAHVTEWIAVIISVTWGPIVLAAPWAAVLALWRTGRRHALTTAPPGWAATAGDTDIDAAVDETTIARALDALRIAQITAYLKDGLPLQYLVPCRRDGRGTHAVIRLPAGVTAERIARRRADLATGLYRQAKEVWPGTGDEAGILDLWIADKGALAEGAGPYPLLESGVTDVFKGVPFGKTLRGDPVRAPLMGRNTITGGMPEQGKSSAARVIMCGAALDITAELRIHIPDTNYDFEVMKPRCSRYVMGADDDSIRQIRDDLLDLEAEVQRRGELLVEHEVPEVTRELASAGIGLHPLFDLLEEAHIAIQHHEYGKEISRLLVSVVKLGRKRGIHMLVSTQAPVRGSMPPDVTRNCTNGIAFAVGDNYANDALLGAGAYAAGHRATELIPGTDRGTALVKGFTGQRSEVVQVHFLSVARGNDQVTPVIGRALAEMARRGRAMPGTGCARRAIESRDLLADLDAVLGDERVRLADVPALLRDLAPGWAAYRQLTATGLRDLLDAQGVRVTNTGNVLRLDPAALRRVLADRE